MKLAISLFGILTALAAHAGTSAIDVSSSDQQKLGIASMSLTAAHVRASYPAYVRVLDPGVLAALDADLAGARAAASASARNADRLTRLAAEDESASSQAAEAAVAQSVADAARVDALARQLSVDWAPALAAMSPEQRAGLLRQLVDGTAALLRADTAEPVAGGPAVLSVATGGGAPREAETLGPAGAVDPRMQTFGLLCVLRGGDLGAAVPGRVLSGRLFHGNEQTGVVIPRAAIVRLDGEDWVYVRTAAESFQRRQLHAATPIDDGWFATDGFAPGDNVVNAGAGSLLAIERADESSEGD